MAKKRKIDILDILPPEAIKAVDELGYKFLASRDYDVEGAIESKEKRKELKKALEANGETLRYVGGVDKENKTILVFYEIIKDGKRIATSEGLKFIPIIPEGGQSGEGREDIASEERPSESSEVDS